MCYTPFIETNKTNFMQNQNIKKNEKNTQNAPADKLILITGIGLIVVSLLVIIFAILQSQTNKKTTEQQKSETEKTSQKSVETKTNLQDLMVAPGDKTPPALGNQSNEGEK
jgi:flagellar basal body-associated protein FliL